MNSIGNVIYNETAGSAAHSTEKPCPPEQPNCGKTNFRNNTMRNGTTVPETATPGIANTNPALSSSTKSWIV